jgi:hypothetical protein
MQHILTETFKTVMLWLTMLSPNLCLRTIKDKTLLACYANHRVKVSLKVSCRKTSGNAITNKFANQIRSFLASSVVSQ